MIDTGLWRCAAARPHPGWTAWRRSTAAPVPVPVGTRPTHAADRCIPQLTCGEVRGAAAPRTAAFAGARMGQALSAAMLWRVPVPGGEGRWCFNASVPAAKTEGRSISARSLTSDGLAAARVGLVVGLSGGLISRRHRSMYLQASEWFGAIR